LRRDLPGASMRIPRGPERPNWKGAAASYKTVHSYMGRHYPRTGRCELCGRTDRRTEYARGRRDKITLNWADWFEFCRSCHRRFDGSYVRTPENRAATGERSRGRRLSAETRAKISAAKLGVRPLMPKSAQTRAKLSTAARERPRDAAGRWTKRLD
jgi:hypothetical protein